MCAMLCVSLLVNWCECMYVLRVCFVCALCMLCVCFVYAVCDLYVICLCFVYASCVLCLCFACALCVLCVCLANLENSKIFAVHHCIERTHLVLPLELRRRLVLVLHLELSERTQHTTQAGSVK